MEPLKILALSETALQISVLQVPCVLFLRLPASIDGENHVVS